MSCGKCSQRRAIAGLIAFGAVAIGGVFAIGNDPLELLGRLLHLTAYGIVPVAFFLGGCPCCDTPPPCGIGADIFDRADSTTIGADWTEVAGDWAIASNLLDPPSNGVITYNPTGNPGEPIRWLGYINFGGATGTVRFIVDYLDSSNYHYAEFVCTGSTVGHIRVWRRASGVNTAIGPQTSVFSLFSWSSPQPIAVCWGDGFIEAAAILTARTSGAGATAHGGTAVGLATTTIGSSARFSSVSLSHLREDCDDCPDVEECSNCLDNEIPKYAKLVVSGIVNDTCLQCTRWNGTFIMSAPGGIADTRLCDDVSVSGCGWGFSRSIASTCLQGGISFGLAIHIIAGEYWITLRGGVTVTNPAVLSDPEMWWTKKLEGVTSDPDCFALLEAGIEIPWYCDAETEDGGGNKCDASASTVFVSMP